MKTFNDENKRQSILKALAILDTKPEERYDRITRIASKYFNVPISTITLIDSDREWFKSCYGLKKRNGLRAISFCGHTINYKDSFIIKDASKDKRFKDNPMVTGKEHIRFYAGIPIFSPDGVSLGAFCIKDRVPRNITKEQINDLKAFASWASIEMFASEVSKDLLDAKFNLWKLKKK